MYSLLLMTALTAGPDANAFGGRFASCHGCCGVPVSCYGCCGYSYGCCGYSYGCCGYSYGCCGYSYGCCGGGGLFSRLHAHKSSCCGYHSSCCGSSCCGGSWAAYGCCGGACWGSCYGSMYSGAYYGSGCFGYGVIVGGPMVVDGAPIVTVPAAPAPGAAAPAATTPAVGSPTSSTSEKPYAAPAKLVIELPAAAKLYVDGKATRGEGPSRQFHTPVLPAGQPFFYEMRAEVEVDGKLEVEEKRVVVRAGDDFTQSFPKLIAAVAAPKADAVAAK